jgi:hypothetical protein
MEVSRRRGKLNPPNRAIHLHEMALLLQHKLHLVIVCTQPECRYTSTFPFKMYVGASVPKQPSTIAVLTVTLTGTE